MAPSTKLKPGKTRPAFEGDGGTPSPQAKFTTARRDMAAALVERDDEIDLALTALLCQEHVVYVGAPGSAKSHLLDGLLAWIDGAEKFSVLFTKFTTPEEVFGPISVAGLKADKYQRVTTNMMPEAHLSLCDEIWKASSAILNTLLRLLNERQFANGDGTFRPCPLRLCVAASNEWPNAQDGGQELGAVFDRFLFRKPVKYVSRHGGRKELLRRAVTGDDCRPKFSAKITLSEVDFAHREAVALLWSDDAKKALWELLSELDKAGVTFGDRRLYKGVNACRAFAYLHGGREVRPEHLEILAHVLWDSPEEQPKKCAEVVMRIANPVSMHVTAALDQINAVMEEAGDLASMGAAAAIQTITKIGDVQDKLEKLADDPRKDKALAYAADAVKRLQARVTRTKVKDDED